MWSVDQGCDQMLQEVAYEAKIESFTRENSISDSRSLCY